MGDPSAEAMSLVGVNLAASLFVLLRQRGVISEADASGILDGVLTKLETEQPNDEVTRIARQILEAIGEAT